MGKVVQIKGVKTAGPALHLNGKSKAASVKSSPMGNKKAVVDMPSKKVTGMQNGKNNYSVKSTVANVARANKA